MWRSACLDLYASSRTICFSPCSPAAQAPSDLRCYGSVMAGLAAALRWRQALQLLRRARSRPLALGGLLSSALRCLAAEHRWPQALQLLLSEADVEDAKVHAVAVAACAASWPVALGLLELMTQRQLATKYAASVVMTAALSAQHWHVALKLFETSERDLVSSNVALRACALASLWPRSLELLRHLGSEVRLLGLNKQIDSMSTSFHTSFCREIPYISSEIGVK